MQTTNRIFDDLARVANGAVSTLVGVKEEIEAIVRTQLERILSDMEMVPREEFEAVKEMAAKARAEQEKLEKRVADLEARLSAGTAKRSPSTEKASSRPRVKKTAARKPRPSAGSRSQTTKK
ncbi:MAG: accessory factor UbiK family protein [Rhodospirillales bacterium]|nr:accessory factor UbiK family protein [Rhodospirillales bacterium]